MPSTHTNLDATTVVLTLTVAERTALVDRVSDLPRPLLDLLQQKFVRRDRIRVSPHDLELLDEQLSRPLGRSVPLETRQLLKNVHEQVVDELNLLNARTSSVAIDNAAHTLFLKCAKNKTEPTLQAADELLSKLRALPLRLRGFKPTASEKRLLRRFDLPVETLSRVNSANPSLNLSDVLVILSVRYRLDRLTQAVMIAELLDLRRRIMEYLDQESRRTIEINRKRSLKTQQEWRRKSTNQDA
ncbi:MAG: hypothetical protein JWM11_7187 [Planctomycetaceae bacterium]|nr:hypothetical protein [Planctomycetaceae bacterium]